MYICCIHIHKYIHIHGLKLFVDILLGDILSVAVQWDLCGWNWATGHIIKGKEL